MPLLAADVPATSRIVPPGAAAHGTIETMTDTPYWRVHVRVDEAPLSTLTFTRASDGYEDAGEIGAEAVRTYADLPEEWTVHVEVSGLAGPANGQDALGPL